MGNFRQLSPELWPLIDVRNLFLCLPPKGWETYCFSPGVWMSGCLDVRLSVRLSVTNRVRSVT